MRCILGHNLYKDGREAGPGRGRGWTVNAVQEKPHPTPLCAVKLGSVFRDVLNGGEGLSLPTPLPQEQPTFNDRLLGKGMVGGRSGRVASEVPCPLPQGNTSLNSYSSSRSFWKIVYGLCFACITTPVFPLPSFSSFTLSRWWSLWALSINLIYAALGFRVNPLWRLTWTFYVTISRETRGHPFKS